MGLFQSPLEFLLGRLELVHLRIALSHGFVRIAVFGMCIVLLVPPVMHFVGHYRSYYRWMTYMPLCVFTPLLVERALAVRFSSLLRALAGLTVAAAIGMGVPLRTVHVLTTWQERSTKPIEDAIH